MALFPHFQMNWSLFVYYIILYIGLYNTVIQPFLTLGVLLSVLLTRLLYSANGIMPTDRDRSVVEELRQRILELKEAVDNEKAKTKQVS